ncbi:ATP-binding protein [Rubinisphaera margarita]|uniref:ATP-binding protein n=1 Tax=Rubinisphaera margarita TaxID=2909586 RepID=UPI001EE7DD4C|nr:ATP-binding protein [Rubinisphaera margarita]MCG6156615.1 ATP-binding protein [Rubinisphaera margarita]
MKVRILILDSQDPPLSSRIEAHPNWELVTVQETGAACTLIRDRECHLAIANDTQTESLSKALREECNADLSEVPIIVVSSGDDHTSTVNSLSLGAICFVPKSAPDLVLSDVIHRILRVCGYGVSQESIFKDCLQCHFVFRIDNDTSIVANYVSQLREIISVMTNASTRDRIRVAVATEEALLNAIIHGNLEVDSALRNGDGTKFVKRMKERQAQAPYEGRRVRLTTNIGESSIEVIVADEGPGFDRSAIPDPTDPDFIMRPHGRGLLLIQTFMDDVSFNETGNEITMRKSFETEPSDA